MKSPNLLQDIYEEWLEKDDSHMEDLRQTIADFKSYMVKTEKILSGKESLQIKSQGPKAKKVKESKSEKRTQQTDHRQKAVVREAEIFVSRSQARPTAPSL